mgnify:CR=1 FL=1
MWSRGQSIRYSDVVVVLSCRVTGRVGTASLFPDASPTDLTGLSPLMSGLFKDFGGYFDEALTDEGASTAALEPAKPDQDGTTTPTAVAKGPDLSQFDCANFDLGRIEGLYGEKLKPGIPVMRGFPGVVDDCSWDPEEWRRELAFVGVTVIGPVADVEALFEGDETFFGDEIGPDQLRIEDATDRLQFAYCRGGVDSWFCLDRPGEWWDRLLGVWFWSEPYVLQVGIVPMPSKADHVAIAEEIGRQFDDIYR